LVVIRKLVRQLRIKVHLLPPKGFCKAAWPVNAGFSIKKPLTYAMVASASASSPQNRTSMSNGKVSLSPCFETSSAARLK
jgi:hypothetical protein